MGRSQTTSELQIGDISHSISLPLVRLADYEDPRHEFLVFVAHINGSTLLLFYVYRSPSVNCEVFDVISYRIDSFVTKCPSSATAEWLVHSRTAPKTRFSKRYKIAFAGSRDHE